MTRKRLLLLSDLVAFPIVRVLLHIVESLTVFPHSMSISTLAGHWVFAALIFCPAAIVTAKPDQGFARTCLIGLAVVALTLGLLEGPWLLSQHASRLVWAETQAKWDFGRYLLATIPTAAFIAYAGRPRPERGGTSLR